MSLKEMKLEAAIQDLYNALVGLRKDFRYSCREDERVADLQNRVTALEEMVASLAARSSGAEVLR